MLGIHIKTLPPGGYPIAHAHSLNFELLALRSASVITTSARFTLTAAQTHKVSLNHSNFLFLIFLGLRHWGWGVILGPGNSLSPLSVKAKRGWGSFWVRKFGVYP